LEGNHVEERFSYDYVDKPNPSISNRTENRDKYHLNTTLYNRGNYAWNERSTRSTSITVPERPRNESTLTKEYYDTKEKLKLMDEHPNLKVNNELQKSLALNMRGEKSHILFGHGLKEDSFKDREFATSYDLAFNQKIKPKDFLHSKFNASGYGTCHPNLRDETIFHTNGLRTLPQFGDKNNLTTKKTFKHYEEYTKTFDMTHKNTGLRK